MGKGETAGNQHFLIFQQNILPYQELISSFVLHLQIVSCIFLFSLTLTSLFYLVC